MFWRYEPTADAANYPRPRCEDHSFLKAVPEQALPDVPYNDDIEDAGPTCLVRQVSERAAERGEHGWYWVASAPHHCRDTSAAAMIPEQRPDLGWKITTYLQCKAAVAFDVETERVHDVADLSECAQPQEAPLEELGTECNPQLNLSSQDPTLQLGAAECSSGVCLTRRIPQGPCPQQAPGAPFACTRTLASSCTCRCAGELPDDPGPFCTCPDAFECKPVLSSYSATPELRGSYCFPIVP